MSAPLLRLSNTRDHVLVVGDSRHTQRVLGTLSRSGAQIRLCCVAPSPALADLIVDHELDWQPRLITPQDVADASMVIATDTDAAINTVARNAARRAGRLFLDATTGRGDFELVESAARPAARDDPWQHAQVCLVGAGPGDPGLLTLDGQQALAGADVVLYDRLVAPALLDYAPAGAARRFVGKQRGDHAVRQRELNALMIEMAHGGHRVLRLKGGDPFVFGRGSEEMIALAEAGVATRVIPGVTAGSGCATYADIPLTHRGIASSCQFLTAHGRHGELEHDWRGLARRDQTLVIYMGVMALAHLAPRLTAHGMDPDTPAALIERGTTPEQRVLTGTIGSLPQIAARHTVTAPAVLIVGAVVALRDRMRAGAPLSGTIADHVATAERADRH
ncbi:uroporphyrinogen-III C-methyltransferase [Salinisphaera sp. Q1T1-3]|uniref:uroporphyrinogen-III C-methyltransferase n=1 Tax=Salinisphaera sp. Q1T1-3 TaxID=2321229 RepID=UPI000E712091|nr:uroporphyrinogen-III C-methyltransferase [Salinisphaera sp. Q1T1-3]RJS95115.1 uroporphyrinogen-III C-methyltransferase [Salinisphaera sp. Q1T1-3]